MISVNVFYKKQLAGILKKTSDDQFIFTYEKDYLQSASPPISLTLPKQEEPFNSSDLFPFFDGLIPEGWLLNLASTELRLNPLRDRFELLMKLCHETIGAVHIGDKPVKALPLKTSHSKAKIKTYHKCLICYQKTQDIYHETCMKSVFGRKIHPILDIDEEIIEKIAKTQLNHKLALAGVQRKLSLEIEESNGRDSRLTVTDLWGRFILKPKGQPPHLPENEHLCLRLAEAANIQVEKSALIPTATGDLAFITCRFDRNEFHEEFHQEDFCQLLGKAAYKKYNGSLEQVGKFLKQNSDFPGDNLYRLYELSIFNFLIGNVDAHLKNLTLIYENSSGQKKILSPAYDIISTDLYLKGDNEESALAINGKKNQLKIEDFLSLAKSYGISNKVHDSIVKKFKKILPSWDNLIELSFLDEEKKSEFKQLIRLKLSKFEN